MKTLIVIGGKSGTAEGDKVVGHIVQALISHVFLSDITWTGKAGKGKEKKIALEKYANIVRVIFSLCHNADHSYTLQKCRNAVIYKVLKHAYRAKSVIGATQRMWNKKMRSRMQTSMGTKKDTNTHKRKHWPKIWHRISSMIIWISDMRFWINMNSHMSINKEAYITAHKLQWLLMVKHIWICNFCSKREDFCDFVKVYSFHALKK